jgi:hypothetical protein
MSVGPHAKARAACRIVVSWERKKLAWRAEYPTNPSANSVANSDASSIHMAHWWRNSKHSLSAMLIGSLTITD